MKLKEYINQNYKSQADFARKIGKTKQQVHYWISREFIVFENRLYAPRQEIIGIN